MLNFKKRKIERAYRTVFNSEAGKQVIEDLATFMNFADCTTVSYEPQLSAFNDGQRRVLLRILSLSKTDPITVAQNALPAKTVTEPEDEQ